MPKIPLLPPNRYSDEVAPGVGGVELLDGFCDEVGGGDWALSRRGGLWPWWLSGFNSKIDGLYWWDDKSLLLVVCGGRVFSFNDLVTAPTEITTPTVRLNHNVPANFESSGGWVFITSTASKPIIWNGDATTSAKYLLDAPAVDSFAFSNDHILMNETGTNNVRMADSVVNSTDNPTYQIGQFFRPDANPDRLVAIDSRFGEVLLFGPRSVEFWAFDATKEDPLVPFSRISGGYLEYGLASAQSLVFFDGAHFWLTPDRQVVKLVGRTVEVISRPFDRVFRAMTSTEDTYGYIIDKRFYVICFPTDDFAFVYDFNNGAWYKWCYFTNGQYSRFLGSCAAWSPKWGVQFVGHRFEGRVMIYHRDLVTDLLTNPVRMLYRTAHMDHGTMEPKQCNKLMLRLRRGV